MPMKIDMVDWRRIPRIHEGKDRYNVTCYNGPECSLQKNGWDEIEINADDADDAVKKILEAGYYTRRGGNNVCRIACPDWSKHPDRDWCNN